MPHEGTFSLAIFCLAYLLFVVLPTRRTWVAIGASAALLIAGVLTPAEALEAINWNIMGIFVGTLVIADLFIESHVPAWLAEQIVNRCSRTWMAMLFLCLLSGVISAFVENVATVLIIAPIALALSRKLSINPVSLLIGIAISSNLQGAATLIGDPPSMLLAAFAKINFMEFFIYKGRLSLFFFVQAASLASLAVLYLSFRHHRENVMLPREERVRTWVPTWLLVGMIVALAISSFLDTGFTHMAGQICLAVAIIGVFWDMRVNKGSFLNRLKTLDWDTTFFLVGIFVLVGSLTASGWTSIIADRLSAIIGRNIPLGFVLIVTITMVFSGFIDNVPFLAAMLPVTMQVSQTLGMDPTLFLFGLLIGASVGGNITPIGASANIVTIGLLKKQGHTVGFGRFMAMGVPFTLVAVTVAALLIWWVWGPR